MLIISAEDFGLSPVFNESIISLLDAKCATATSAFVNRKILKSQIESLKKTKANIGLQFEFEKKFDLEDMEKQYCKFKKVFGKPPTHLTLHNHEFHHKKMPLLGKFARDKKLPMRNYGNKYSKVKMPSEMIVGTGKDFLELKKNILNLNIKKTCEIIFHPGEFDRNSAAHLNLERRQDIDALLRLKIIIDNHKIKLGNYSLLK